MRRYLVWSVLLHVVVLAGGAMVAPLSGFVGPSRPQTVITVGLVDAPDKGKSKGKSQAQKPKPDDKLPVAIQPPPGEEKPKPKPAESTKTKKQNDRKKDTTRTEPPQLAKVDTTVSGTLSEGAGEEDVWGVETGAGVNPYHRQGFAAIRANWRNPIVGPIPRKCVVAFRVEHSGEIKDVKLEQSSGLDLFDRAALRAVQLTESWPRFPAGWTEDEQIIHLEFEYRP